MSDRKLEKFLTEINSLQTKMSRDPMSYSERTRPGITAAKNAAKKDIVAAKDAYNARVLEQLTVVFVKNSPQELIAKLVETAAEGNDVFCADGRELYVRLAYRIDSSLGKNRQFLSTHGTIVVDELQKIVSEAGFPGMLLVPKMDYSKALPSFEDSVVFVHKLMNNSNGEGLNTHMILKEVLGDALETGFVGKSLVAVVENAFPETKDSIKAFVGATLDVQLDETTDLDALTKSIWDTKKKKSAAK